MIALGIDIGGSAVKAGVVDTTGAILAKTSGELPKGQIDRPETVLEAAVSAGRRALEIAGLTTRQVPRAGVGVPGIVDAPRGVVVAAANLPGLNGFPLATTLSETLGVPVNLANDANAAALGEARFGAQGKLDSLGLFTLGTGIGGGLVIDGRIVTGHHGFAAELGHMRMEMSNPRPCGCGRWGCLEAYAGGKSIIKRAHEALAEDWKKTSSLHAVAEKQTFSVEDVFVAARCGDPLATRLVEETALALAVGAVNLIHLLDPQVVLFAGGMTSAGDGFLELINSFAADLALPGVSLENRIRFASLGADAGLLGAAALALS